MKRRIAVLAIGLSVVLAGAWMSVAADGADRASGRVPGGAGDAVAAHLSRTATNDALSDECLCPTIDWPIVVEHSPQVWLKIKTCAIDYVRFEAIDRTTVVSDGVTHVVKMYVDNVDAQLEAKGVPLVAWTTYDGKDVRVAAAKIQSMENLYTQTAPGIYAQDKVRVVVGGETLVVLDDIASAVLAWFGNVPVCPTP